MNQANDPNDDFDEMQDWLEGQDGSGAELWNPEVGGTLIGTFLRYETRYSPKIGGDCKVAIIEEARTGDLHAVWLSRSVLAKEYERQAPREGDRVGHKYHGQKQPRSGGQAYHAYTVRVWRSQDGPPTPAIPSPPAPSPMPVPVGASSAGQTDDIPF